jgi:hypothetical protein
VQHAVDADLPAVVHGLMFWVKTAGQEGSLVHQDQVARQHCPHAKEELCHPSFGPHGLLHHRR